MSLNLSRLFEESSESHSRLVLVIYGITMPVFSVAIQANSLGNGLVPTILVLFLCIFGCLWTLLAPNKWDWKWIISGSVVPITCCGIAAVSLHSSGLVFMALLTAPLMVSAVLFKKKTVVSSLLVSGIFWFWVAAITGQLMPALFSTLLFLTVEGLVAWVVFMKASGLRAALQESRYREMNECEFTVKEDGSLSYANRLALSTYGYGESEISQLKVADLEDKGSAGTFEEKVKEFGDEPPTIFESVHVKRDGSRFYVEINSRSFRYKGVRFIHCVVRDITERKQKESNLQNLNDELRGRLDFRDKLLSILSHDLNNSFGAFDIAFGAAMDRDSLSQEEFYTQFLPAMKSMAAGSVLLLDDLLQWSRLSYMPSDSYATKVEVMEVFGLVSSTCLPVAFAKGIKLVFDGFEDSSFIGNSHAAATILRNFIMNAIKYSTSESSIFIKMSQCPTQSTVRFEVCDRGIGIPPERIPTIFSFKNKMSTPGTDRERGNGVALALCKDLATQMGALIEVESQAGKGSKFSLTCRQSLSSETDAAIHAQGT